MAKSARPFAIVVLALLLCGCTANPQVADESTNSAELLVRTVKPIEASEGEMIVGTGTVRARNETVLSFTVPGRVAKLQVDEGSIVSRGAILALLDPAKVAAATAAAEAELTRAQAEYDRQKFLFDRGWVAQPRVDAAKAALNAAKAVLQSTRFDVRQSSIRAPNSGTVLIRHVEANEIVAAGQPIVTLAENARGFVIGVPVSDRNQAKLRLGMPANVKLESVGTEPTVGKIVEIGALGDSTTGTFEIEIGLPRDSRIKSGMIGSVEISLPSASETDTSVELPALAVFNARGGQGFVYVVEMGVARPRLVEIDRVDGNRILISGGLDSNDVVIVSGIERLRPGTAVRIVR